MRHYAGTSACAAVLLPFLLAFPCQGSARSPSGPSAREIREADRYCQFGRQALNEGNIKRARELFDKAVKTLPNFPEAHMGRGHLAMGEKSFEVALHEYDTARDSYLEFSGSLLQLQVLHYTQAQGEISALRDQVLSYRRLLNSRSSINVSHLERTITQLEAQIQQLETIKPPSMEASPDAPGEVHFYIGNALFNLGRLDEAIAEWETCAKTTSRFPLVYNNLAVAYWKKGQLDQALESVTRAEHLGLPMNSNLKADLERSAAGRVAKAPAPPAPPQGP